MKFLQKNRLILIIVALVVALVLIRTFSSNSFRYDAVKWASSSADGSNLISADQLAGEGEKALLISLVSTAEMPVQFKNLTVTIPPGEILDRENIRVIRKNKGPVVLISGDTSVSARVWMVLSETGIKNLYILTDKGAEAP
jgi:hypothetical protein